MADGGSPELVRRLLRFSRASAYARQCNNDDFTSCSDLDALGGPYQLPIAKVHLKEVGETYNLKV